MELQAFISTVLVSLVRGVEDAQSQLKDSKATVNPLGIRSQIALEQNKEAPEFTNVEFEVALEVQSKGEKSGGIGVQVACIKVGVNGNKSKSESQVNRLRFSIPVHLPPGEVLKAR